MSKYDKAGLAMIPSGYKASKVYSLIPNSSVGDFDFTRASTATRINKDGLIDTVASGVPRLEYPIINGIVGDTPSLLLEPSRTNLLIDSEDFTSNWNLDGVTVLSNNVISPDGTLNADKITFVSGNERLYYIVSTTSAVFSIYLKGVIGEQVKIRDASGVIVTTVTLTENWERYEVFINQSNSNIQIENINAEYVYAFGAQLESGAYSTSYIPTSGSSVTRATETCIDSGSTSEINSQEGVLFCEIASNSETADTRQVISLGDGSSGDNRVSIEYNSGTTNEIRLQLRTSTLQASVDHTVDSTKTFHKVVGRYKLNDVQLWIDGFRVGRDQTSDVSAVDALQVLSFRIPASSYFFGRCKQLISFKEYLTESEIEDLTSWDSFNEMATAQEYIIK
jgi:hypothetical protein